MGPEGPHFLTFKPELVNLYEPTIYKDWKWSYLCVTTGVTDKSTWLLFSVWSGSNERTLIPGSSAAHPAQPGPPLAKDGPLAES